DDHRLELEVIDVGRDDRAAAGDFVADELSRQSLADGDEFHLGRDLALARVVQLGDAAAGYRARAVQARLHPGGAPFRQAARDVVALRTARIVNAQARCAVLERDLAHRHADAPGTIDKNFSGRGERCGEL